MDLPETNPWYDTTAYDIDMANQLALVTYQALDRKLPSSPHESEEIEVEDSRASDTDMHDEDEDEDNQDHVDEMSSHAPHFASRCDSPPIVIKTEKTKDEGEEEQAEQNEEEASEQSGAKHDGIESHADYIRDGMSELHSWMSGRAYTPEQQEPQRALLSSLQKFQECRNACNNIVHDLIEELKSVPENDHVLRVLADSAYPDTDEAEKIGLQGAAGSGKSSLINALLNIPGLALADCGVDACSRFPIEYAAPYPGQVKPIAIQIRLFSERIRLNLLKEQLIQYREQTAQSEDEDEDAEESEQACKRRQEAIDFFKAMFGDKPPFRNPTTMQEFLSQQPIDTTCATLQQWLSQLLEVKKVNSDSVSLGASNPIDFNDLLEPYIGSLDDFDNTSSQASLWPVIESIRVHVASAILDSGVVLIDAPGVSDSNEYRVKVAQTSLKGCSHIIVVLHGKRARNDTDAKKTIEKVSKRIGSDMIAVMTHSDTTWDSLANRKIFKEDEKLAEIGRHEMAIKAKIQHVKKALKKQPTQLQAELQTLQMRQKSLSGVKLGRQMEIATAAAQQKIRNVYAEQLSSRSSKIYNVSNSLYTVLACDYDHTVNVAPPVKVTGIPGLRESIRKIGEHPQIRRLSDHIKYDLPNALSNISLWCDPSQIDISSIAKPAIQESIKDCTMILEDLLKNLLEASQEHVIRTIQGGIEEWMDESRDGLERHIAERYRGNVIRVASVNAFINKHGCHTPAGKPSVDLNEILMEYTSQKLNEGFKKFKENALKSSEKAKESLLSNCDILIRKIENSEASLVLAQKRDLLRGKRTAIQAAISAVFQNITRALALCLRELRAFATDTDHDCCIMQILNPVYEDIRNKYPRVSGYCRARQAAFYQYIHDDELYTDYLFSIEEYNSTTLNMFHVNSVQVKIKPIFEDLHQALSEFCIPPKISQEELESRAGVGKSVEAKLRLLEGEILPKFRESCRDTDASKTGQKRKRSD